MLTALLVVHLLVSAMLVGVVLLQRSEGGALGIGGGNFFSPRGASSTLTRFTAILATVFMVLALALSYLSRGERPESLLDVPPAVTESEPTETSGTRVPTEGAITPNKTTDSPPNRSQTTDMTTGTRPPVSGSE